MRPKKSIYLIITLEGSPFYDATRSCTCSLVASIHIAKAKWQNSRKNNSPLKCYKLHNIILRVKCYVTAATAYNNISNVKEFFGYYNLHSSNSNTNMCEVSGY